MSGLAGRFKCSVVSMTVAWGAGLPNPSPGTVCARAGASDVVSSSLASPHRGLILNKAGHISAEKEDPWHSVDSESWMEIHVVPSM